MTAFILFQYYLIKEKQIENIQGIYAFDVLHFRALAHYHFFGDVKYIKKKISPFFCSSGTLFLLLIFFLLISFGGGKIKNV